MKKLIVATFSVSLMLASCQKEGGNKGVLKENQETVDNQTDEQTYRYVAEDGSSANVTFSNSATNGNYIKVLSNQRTIRVKEKEKTANGAIYEENGVLIKSEGDSVTITQDNNVIELKRARGQ